MQDIDRDMVFSVAEGVEITEVPDGRVLYQPGRERVHFLNPTAVVVVELCGQKFSVGQIESFLKDAYGLEDDPAASVRECIQSLLSEDLLRPSAP